MQCIVFTRLPGTGKSSIAEAVGRELGIPVFAKDWLDATVRQCGWEENSRDAQPVGYVGYALLTMLAERQLQLAQSVILDSVASPRSMRERWQAVAEHYGARWQVIECVCSDAQTHRARLAVRRRGIPAWDELAWAEVERVKTYYEPWDGDRLVLDAMDRLTNNIQDALTYLSGAAHSDAS